MTIYETTRGIMTTHSTWILMMIPLAKALSPLKSSSSYSWDLNPNNAPSSAEISPVISTDI